MPVNSTKAILTDVSRSEAGTHYQWTCPKTAHVFGQRDKAQQHVEKLQDYINPKRETFYNNDVSKIRTFGGTHGYHAQVVQASRHAA